MNSPNPKLRLVSGGLALLLLPVGALLVLRHEPAREESHAIRVDSPAAPSTSATQVSQAAHNVMLRPLPVSISRNHHEWTSGDAKDPAVIAKIAHNPEESKRLTEENARIKRRQLVYRTETLPKLIQRGGVASLKEFTLPGLDGREFQVEVVETRVNGLHAGSVMGRVKGRMNSMVSVGFYNGCESFNVSLPDEALFLTADAREPGEVLVKEIDPEVYFPPAKCEPIVIE